MAFRADSFDWLAKCSLSSGHTLTLRIILS